jgi:hypothetical protein
MEATLKEFRDWLNAYQDNDPWLHEKNIDRELAKLYRFNRAIKRKAAIGVYGQSQAGKSFLINSLLKKGNKSTKIRVGRDEELFDNLNPDYGAEATAVTCRFTNEFVNDKDDFIHGEFHTVGEIVRILFAAINELDLTQRIALIDEYSFDIQDIPVGTEILSQYQVFDLLDHIDFLINDNGRQSKVGQTLINIYQIIEDEYLDNLSFKTVEYLISFLWAGFQKFEKFVKEIFELYSKLNNISSFKLQKDILKDTLNTSTLRAPLNEQPKINLNVSSTIIINKGSQYNLSVIQIACSEIILPLVDESILMNDVDILDFPGLRPMAEHSNLKKPEEIRDNYQEIIKTIKQGKLKATFYLYSQRMEIPSLLLVTADGNQDAQSLPKLVKSWIQQNCSDGDEHIDSSLVNKYLFTALTKSDKLLRETTSLDRDDFIERIKNRFRVHFENFFDDFLSKIDNYNNVFMTINTSVDIHNLVTGNDKQLAKNVFTNDELVQKYLGKRVEQTFDSFYSKNGGVDLLKDHLKKVSKDLSNKKKKYLNRSIKGIRDKVLDHAQNYLIDPDDQRQLEKEREKAKQFSRVLENNIALYYVLSHYQSNYFPENISFRGTERVNDPLGIGLVNEDENYDRVNFEESYNALLDSYYISLSENQRNYRYYKIYLKQIDDTEMKYYFLKVIDYLKSNQEMIDNLFDVYSCINIENKQERRSFIQFLKYMLVSEITGYKSLNNGEKPQEKISEILEMIYTSTIPKFNEEANQELELIIKSLRQSNDTI